MPFSASAEWRVGEIVAPAGFSPLLCDKVYHTAPVTHDRLKDQFR